MFAQRYRRAKPHLLYSISFCIIFSVTLWILRRSFDPLVPVPLAPTQEPDTLQNISNATLGFERIFVVNQPSRTDRRDAMTLAAAFSKITFDWIDAILGHDVLRSTLPLGKAPESLPRPEDLGRWRSHLNAIRAVVEQGSTTALIMDDDLDWDVRIREQMRNFALAARALLQPLSVLMIGRADPTYPSPFHSQEIVKIPFEDLPATAEPRKSLYGDHWDVLWVGHCSMHYAQVPDEVHSLGRVIQLNDETVSGRKHNPQDARSGQYIKDYPDHARIYHHTIDSTCSYAYAVTQHAARKILWEVGVEEYSASFDVMLGQLCDGRRGIERKLTCITTQPSLFNHWRPRKLVNVSSNIHDMGAVGREVTRSDFIRWSVGVNMERFVRGELDNWIDQYPSIERERDPQKRT